MKPDTRRGRSKSTRRCNGFFSMHLSHIIIADIVQPNPDLESALRLEDISNKTEEEQTEKEELFDNVKVADEATAMTHKEVVTADGQRWLCKQVTIPLFGEKI